MLTSESKGLARFLTWSGSTETEIHDMALNFDYQGEVTRSYHERPKDAVALSDYIELPQIYTWISIERAKMTCSEPDSNGSKMPSSWSLSSDD